MNNIIYDPNYVPGQAIYFNPVTNEQRLIPFLGGAIIGGIGGAAISNNQGYGNYYQSYYPYPVYYYPSYYSPYPMYYNQTQTSQK